MVRKLLYDFEDMHDTLVLKALHRIFGVRAVPIDRHLDLFVASINECGTTSNDELINGAMRNVRVWMTDQNTDLFNWRNINPIGRTIVLHFTGTASSCDELPARFRRS